MDGSGLYLCAFVYVQRFAFCCITTYYISNCGNIRLYSLEEVQCINATRCAHVHTDKYLENLNKVAAECETHNIKLLFVAMCFPSYNKIKTLSHEYDFVIPSFGIHPWRADRYSSNLISLDKYLAESKYIGEIGLYKRFLKICGILH